VPANQFLTLHLLPLPILSLQTQESIESFFEKLGERLQVNGDNIQSKIQNIFEKLKYPSLLARCYHHLGEHYVNQVKGLYSYIRTVEKNYGARPSWQTKKQAGAEKSITVKQEEIAAFTKKAIQLKIALNINPSIP
jgi:hypothetical protein